MKKAKPNVDRVALLKACTGDDALLNLEQEAEMFRAVDSWSEMLAHIHRVESKRHLKPVDYETPNNLKPGGDT